MRASLLGEREFTSDGATLFGAFCTGCHGRKGEGYRVPGMVFPSVANPDFLAVAPDALIAETIVRGRPGRRMQAWTERATGLTSADVAAEAVRRGDSLTPDAVRQAARARRLLPCAVTVGGVRLYSLEDVERWLAERAQRRGDGRGPIAG